MHLGDAGCFEAGPSGCDGIPVGFRFSGATDACGVCGGDGYCMMLVVDVLTAGPSGLCLNTCAQLQI